MLFVAERVAGGRFLKADRGGDVTGIHLRDILTVVRVHQQDAAQTLALTLGGVQDSLAGFDRAGIDTEERQTADVRVGHHLERQTRKTARNRPAARVLDLIRLGHRAGDQRDIQRRRHIIDDRVQQLLHALILIGRAAHEERT